MLDLSVGSGVTTPDELRLSVYDDAGALWNDTRVPASGALVPESATHLGTVLIQPGAAPGALRVHARGLVASARVADGVLTIPAGSRGTFALRLDAEVPVDGDDDGVPDPIDDCPATANPNQGGCPGTNDGGDGGADDARRRGARAEHPMTAGRTMSAAAAWTPSSCEASGACNRANGAACADSVQCSSSFCVDGVCCANACLGPCRSCNQPNNDGICQPYAQGTNPAAECTGGMTCNGAGACGPADGRAQSERRAVQRHHGLHVRLLQGRRLLQQRMRQPLPAPARPARARRQAQARPARVLRHDDVQRRGEVRRDVAERWQR